MTISSDLPTIWIWSRGDDAAMKARAEFPSGSSKEFSGSLSAPEIGVADTWIGAQFAGRPVEHDAAGLQHIGMVGDLERQARVLLDHEDRRAVLVDRGDQLQHAIDPQGR